MFFVSTFLLLGFIILLFQLAWLHVDSIGANVLCYLVFSFIVILKLCVESLKTLWIFFHIFNNNPNIFNFFQNKTLMILILFFVNYSTPKLVLCIPTFVKNINCRHIYTTNSYKSQFSNSAVVNIRIVILLVIISFLLQSLSVIRIHEMPMQLQTNGLVCFDSYTQACANMCRCLVVF